jgi:beta-glucosidase
MHQTIMKENISNQSTKMSFFYHLFRVLVIVLAINTLPACISDKNNTHPALQDKEIQSLINKMTLEEKVGQMTQITLEVIVKKDIEGEIIRPPEIDSEKMRKALVDYHVGSVINTSGAANPLPVWQKLITTIQNTAMQETPHHIPILYGIDAIHGANYTTGATLFPQQIAQAATFNRKIVENNAAITAYEVRASAIPWNFSPVLGMGRQPLWSRFWETFGEDTYLASELGRAMIKGYQGTDLKDTTHVAACMKHYLGYSNPRTGKDRTPAAIPDRELRQYYLPPFRAAVEEGVLTTMVCSGEINGTPVHANKTILTGILKKELDFKGFAVTDWEDIIYLHTRHKVAPTMREAVKMAVNAGIDMSMVPFKYEEFADLLIDLVKSGEVSEERINDAVTRILYVKKKLGLWETPITHYEGYNKFAGDEFKKTNLEAAREAVILLKNTNSTLPLDTKQKIFVTGPTANSVVPLNGGWSYNWQGTRADEFAENEQTLLEALRDQFANVSYEPGVDYDKEISISNAKRKAASADAVVLCLGESSYCETPGNIEDLVIPEAQQKLASAMVETGKPVILILLEGRPRIVSHFADDVEVILLANLPGNMGGRAIAEIISGKINPSGKLPYTYPRFANHLVTYDHKGTQALTKTDGSPEFNPQFEFGDGMGYAAFDYTNLSLNKRILEGDETLEISVDITNQGKMEGKEAVLLFVTDHFASITPAVKQLKGFQKITLAPGETQKVSFSLKQSDLSFVNKDLKTVFEPGAFSVQIEQLKKEIQWKK